MCGRGKAPITRSDPEDARTGRCRGGCRRLRAAGAKVQQIQAPVAGHYRLRFNVNSVWVGPGQTNKWFIPNLDDISAGRRPEPMTIYSETPPRLLRWLGKFDVTPEPSVQGTGRLAAGG